MHPHTLRTLVWLKAARNRISDHRIQFAKRVALRGDASALGSVPARHIAARIGARLNIKDDFRRVDHVWKIPSMAQTIKMQTLEHGLEKRMVAFSRTD